MSTVVDRVQVREEVEIRRDNYDKTFKNFVTMPQVAGAWKEKYNVLRASTDRLSGVSTQNQELRTDTLEAICDSQDEAQACVQVEEQANGGDVEMDESVEEAWLEQIMSAASED